MSRLRRIVAGVLVGAAALAALAAVAFVLLIVVHDGRRTIDLGRWVGADDDWTRSVMPGARWATEELCGPELPCLQAVRAETLTMYRFLERADAEAAARRFGDDAYLTGWIVIRFEPGGLTPTERSDVEYGIGCINTWVSEDGRDC
ncbi:hypothetical protein [Blastococcus sp. SYSU D00820]